MERGYSCESSSTCYGWFPIWAWSAIAPSSFAVRLMRCAPLGGEVSQLLTEAELRVLPLLASHLTIAEIADRQFVSRATVKTQAISIYRKLGVTGRSEAVERAAEVGLIDQAILPRKREFHLPG